MAASVVVNLVLLELLAQLRMATSSVITQDVLSKNISVNGPTVEFICQASEASYCNWMVNEQYSANHHFVLEELKISNILDKDPEKTANENDDIVCTMTVPTAPGNLLNNTRVQCRPLVALGDLEFTGLQGTTAKMLLQGQYASVGDIHFSNESFTVVARWNPPYHLVGVPPTEYNCTVSILNTYTYLNTTVNHENTSCSFVLEEDMICDVLVLEVIASNQWIGGDTETTYWSLGGSVRPSSISFALAYADSPYLTLSVEYEVVGVCLEQVWQVVVTATCDSWTKSNVRNVSDTFVIKSGATLNATIANVPEDQYCFFVISLKLTTMEAVNTSNRKFSTFDVEDVILTTMDDQLDYNLCVTCVLRRGSEARGCFISLKLHRGNRTELSNFTIGKDIQCRNQEPGLYTVEVFDYDVNGSLSTLAAYVDSDLLIPHLLTPAPPITPVPSTSSVEPDMSSVFTTPSIIALSIGGVVLAVVLLLITLFCILFIRHKTSDRTNRIRQVRGDCGQVEQVALEPRQEEELQDPGGSKPGKINVCLVIGTAISILLVVTLLAALLYVVLARVSECEPVDVSTVDGRSLQKKERGSHKVMDGRNAFQEQLYDDPFQQQYLEHSYQNGKPQVMVFHNTSAQDEDELLRFLHGRYHQLPSEGKMGNVMQWINVKPEKKPDDEI